MAGESIQVNSFKAGFLASRQSVERSNKSFKDLGETRDLLSGARDEDVSFIDSFTPAAENHTVIKQNRNTYMHAQWDIDGDLFGKLGLGSSLKAKASAIAHSPSAPIEAKINAKKFGETLVKKENELDKMFKRNIEKYYKRTAVAAADLALGSQINLGGDLSTNA